jgi:predicted nuclease of predicted toxin-antitoxin system
MKFIIDAHLPRRLVSRLREAGIEAIHTLDLLMGNRTPDSIINELSIREQYIVITKDADFVNSFLLHHKPYKLLLISTGNISNKELETLFLSNIKQIAENFEMFNFIEINRNDVIYHI